MEFATGTPLAVALRDLVQPKLTELGWTTSDDDGTLFDYILLMLANEKNEAQVASELSNDLLDLGSENIETQQFSRWLFEQIHVLRRRLAGGDSGGEAELLDTTEVQMEGTSIDALAPAHDTDMEGAAEPLASNIPTGPKAMRNGSGPKQARGGRMVNQLNKQMSRTDDSALHRVRGSGRINSHSREPPKGPRSTNLGRGLDAMANGRGMGNMNVGHGMTGMNGMNMGGMPNMPMAPNMTPNMAPNMALNPVSSMASNMGQGSIPGMLNPQQQMALMQMYEQQAQMMQQIFSGQTPAAYVNPTQTFYGKGSKKGPGVPRGSGQGSKLSLSSSTKFNKKEGQDESMTDGPVAENGAGMEVETLRSEPSMTMCNFNQRCSKPDCPFVHASPAAPRGAIVDMNDSCTFGAACKNKKCVGKHPSPAQRQQFQAEQECAFFPNCRDPANCPYKHPAMPACRNGADCTASGCKFWHSTVKCKFTPCTNTRCPYKHEEGQKQGFKANVWVAPKNGEEGQREHVSERKFVAESQEEEVILPKASAGVVEAAL